MNAEPRGAEAPAILRRLEERLERASHAADSLLAQARGGAQAAPRSLRGQPVAQDPRDDEGPAGQEGRPGPGRGSGPPPSGWQVPHPPHGPHQTELELLLSALHSAQELIPPELQRRLAEALRELLSAVRALIDWYLERINRKPPATPEVRDIPIL